MTNSSTTRGESRPSARRTSTGSPAQYVTPESMSILVVGDRSQIEAPLLSLPFVPGSARLDALGNPVPESAARKPAALERTRPVSGTN